MSLRVSGARTRTRQTPADSGGPAARDSEAMPSGVADRSPRGRRPGRAGGGDSGWQDSWTYSDSGGESPRDRAGDPHAPRRQSRQSPHSAMGLPGPQALVSVSSLGSAEPPPQHLRMSTDRLRIRSGSADNDGKAQLLTRIHELEEQAKQHQRLQVEAQNVVEELTHDNQRLRRRTKESRCCALLRRHRHPVVSARLGTTSDVNLVECHDYHCGGRVTRAEG